VLQSQTCDRNSARCSKRYAVVFSGIYCNRLAGLIWVQAQEQGSNLVQIEQLREVGSLGADIRNGSHHVSGHLVLNVKVPLLNVGPLVLFGQGDDAEWMESAAAANAAVAGNVALHRNQDARRRIFERFRIGLVAVGVLVKDSVTSPDGRLSLSPRIPGKAYARRRIHEPIVHTTTGYTLHPTSHHAVGKRASIHKETVDHSITVNRGGALHISCGIKIERLLIVLVVQAQQAQP